LRIPSLLGEAKEEGVIAGWDFRRRVPVGMGKENHGWNENQDYPKRDPFCRSQLNLSETILSKPPIYQIFQQFATMRKPCIIAEG
jgi:hypothetical protein